jgi:2-aminoadipate transaminase
MGSSAIRELLKVTEQTDIISFAGGFPAAEYFPVERFREASDYVLKNYSSRALQYGTTEGFQPLREYMVNKMAKLGVKRSVENVLITSGSQQSLDLVGRIFINKGDRIITERPTFIGSMQSWRAYQAEFITLPVDEEGMNTEALDETIKLKPKFMYILPNYQNPAGVTLSMDRRQTIVKLARQYGIPIVEDDPYWELRYEGEHLPSLLSLDEEMGRVRFSGESARDLDHGKVIYLGTFSKTLAPGLRLGWIMAPAELIRDCALAKQGMDLHTSMFVQMVAYQVVKDGFLEEHIAQVREVYRERRDIMLNAMSREFPSVVKWTRPQGGLFLWVTLPEMVNSLGILRKAIESKVAFVPGSAFYPDGGGDNEFRLNYSNAKPEQIEQGIKRLGKVLASELETAALNI